MYKWIIEWDDALQEYCIEPVMLLDARKGYLTRFEALIALESLTNAVGDLPCGSNIVKDNSKVEKDRKLRNSNIKWDLSKKGKK